MSVSNLVVPLQLNSGIKVFDVLRFFHGDGPAQQFEAGNSIGGMAYIAVLVVE